MKAPVRFLPSLPPSTAFTPLPSTQFTIPRLPHPQLIPNQREMDEPYLPTSCVPGIPGHPESPVAPLRVHWPLVRKPGLGLGRGPQPSQNHCLLCVLPQAQHRRGDLSDLSGVEALPSLEVGRGTPGVPTPVGTETPERFLPRASKIGQVYTTIFGVRTVHCSLQNPVK